jgi:hypothetical protein
MSQWIDPCLGRLIEINWPCQGVVAGVEEVWMVVLW